MLEDFVKRALPKTTIIMKKDSIDLNKFLTNGTIPGIEFDDDLFVSSEKTFKIYR